MRLITACCARVPQRWTSRIYIHFLLMFQEVRLISKTRNQLRENHMADSDPRTYKLVELVGTSPVRYAEATKNAIERAGETLRGLGWFQVTELRGLLEEGAISEYQVTLKVGFRVLDRDGG